MIEDAALHQAIARMRGYSRPWAIAGGWAIDIFVGNRTRPHSDVDIATLRVDQGVLRDHLAGASITKVRDGVLTEWSRDETLVLPVHEVHATWPDKNHAEFLLNEGDSKTDWMFRRDPRVTLEFARAFLQRDDVPYLAPEIALLFKSNSASRTNDADFAVALRRMEREQQRWLRTALEITAPTHPWLSRLTLS